MVNLRVERAKRGITQMELAKAAGVSVVTIQKAENNEEVSMKCAKKIAKVLNISYLDFFR